MSGSVLDVRGVSKLPSDRDEGQQSREADRDPRLVFIACLSRVRYYSKFVCGFP